MKLVVAIVQDKDAGRILQALVHRDYRATRLASTGGFLREGNTTLLVGVEEDQVSAVVELIAELGCSREKLVAPLSAAGGPVDSHLPYPVEVTVGGATVFVLPVEQYHRF